MHAIDLLSEHFSLGTFLIALLGAYGGGVLASLTPCVYPMIPITLGVIGSGLGKIRIAIYISGMCVTYSFLGVLAGLTGQIFGSYTNTSNWYLGLGIVLTLAGLISLEVIPFDPARLFQLFQKRKSSSYYHERQKEVSHLAVFVLGATSGFVAAPCTTPILSSILALTAKTQSVGTGLLLMLSFSLGLGTLFMIFGIFAGALKKLPRSGYWLKHLKTGSGLILLGFAQYLIYQAGKRGGF